METDLPADLLTTCLPEFLRSNAKTRLGDDSNHVARYPERPTGFGQAATLYRLILRDVYRQVKAFDFLDEPCQLIRGLEIFLFAGRP